MSDVHGNRIDRSRGAVATRWWGLGILSLARLKARGLLTSCERAQGVEEGRPGSARGRPSPPAAQLQFTCSNRNAAFLLSTSCRSGSIRLAFTPAFQVGARGAETPVNLAWFSR